MSDEDSNPTEIDDAAVETATEPTENEATADGSDESVSTPDFQEMKKGPRTLDKSGELNRLYDVEVTISAELGRTRVPVQELLAFSEGSVFELNRTISSPIELIAQGIPLGNGEVVVVDDTFAIRIKEIYSSQP